MSETKVYLFHELSSYLPLLEGEEFDDLVEDIKQHGQIEPATLFEGKILDGRNRYRACKILKQNLITREWKPSKATGSTPLQYVISENIMRRHLNTAQKAEIGMLLYDEVKKQVEIERRKKEIETKRELGVIQKGKKDFQKNSTLRNKKLIELKEMKKDDWTTTAEQVAKKVRVKPITIKKVKRIRRTAYDKDTGEIKDKSIAEDWEDAKRGETSIDAVYKKVKIKEAIEKLPEDLKKEVKKEEPVITVKEAQVIAEISNVELRKQEVAERARIKKRQELEIKKKKDLAEGKTLPEVKYFDKDTSKVNAFESICKKAVDELTIASLEGYGKIARDACIQMMKMVFEHLRNELKKAGEVAPRKVIDIGQH